MTTEHERRVLFYREALDTVNQGRTWLESQLWQAQLAVWPDSVHVHRGEALGWMYEDSREGIQRRMECWEESNKDHHPRRIADRLAYYEKCVIEERWRMARAVATAMAHDVGIFYECGKQPDGTFRHRGFRFGLEPSQYLSAFTD